MKFPARPLASRSVPAALLLASLTTAPAHAHHLMEGGTASTGVEGFLSGVAHPVIGIDHLAMIVAIGILAAAMRPGFLIAIAFVVAAMGGTGLHLMGINLPGSEELVSLSVVGVGALIALRNSPSSAAVLGICALSGILHGYAYGESIVGAEPTPLAAYLAGFTVIQLLVAGIAFAVARGLRAQARERAFSLRPAGFVVAGAGMAMLAAQLVALSAPL